STMKYYTPIFAALMVHLFSSTCLIAQINVGAINPRCIISGDEFRISSQRTGTPSIVKEDTIIQGIGQGSSLGFTARSGFRHSHNGTKWSQISLFEEGLLSIQFNGRQPIDPFVALYHKAQIYPIWQSERSLFEYTNPLDWNFISIPSVQPDTMFYYDWMIIGGEQDAMAMLYRDVFYIIPFDIQISSTERTTIKWREPIPFEWPDRTQYFISVHHDNTNFIITNRDAVYMIGESEIIKMDITLDIDDYYFIFNTDSKDYFFIESSKVDLTATSPAEITDRMRPIDELLFER
ncbi:MAG: hypothetical protein AAF544_07415, partial [Bacteroidota bacterium]